MALYTFMCLFPYNIKSAVYYMYLTSILGWISGVQKDGISEGAWHSVLPLESFLNYFLEK